MKVIQYAGRSSSDRTLWYCVCDCEPEVVKGPFLGYHLKSGATKSCGCYNIENLKKRATDNKIEFINNDVIKVYCSGPQKYFICDYKTWIDRKCFNVCWRTKKSKNLFYVIGNTRGDTHETIVFHRYILNIKDKNIEVDHKNGNGLDNRNINLRKCSRLDNNKNLKINSRNKSGFTGVGFHKKSNKWRARINYNHKEYNLGFYDNIEDALDARKQGEEIFQKDFSARNSRREKNLKQTISLEEIIKEIEEKNESKINKSQ